MAKNSRITLHKELGINPRMTVCTRCGEDGEALVLLGNTNWIYNCCSCGTNFIGYSKECPKCKHFNTLSKGRELKDYEKLPGLCKKCRLAQEECDKAVAEGGIYWKCADCGSTGALKQSDFTDHVRTVNGKGTKVEGPCGIEFTKEQGCPVCGPEGENNGKENS